MRPLRCLAALLALVVLQATAAEKVIVDLDIGDDLDDAFALSLVLASPELEVLGISTAWGDTGLRARMVERLLRENGRGQLPISQGLETQSQILFSQARWAQRGALPPNLPSSVDFLLQQIHKYPGQITLLALAPLSNIAAAIDRDPATFRQLKRVVMMGGSLRSGYNKSDYLPVRPPDKEYNIAADIPAAQKLFAAGVPITMFPLDSTLLRLDNLRREALFSHGSPQTDALTLLYHQWSNAYQPWASDTPTLFDVVPVAALVDPGLCTTTPLRIEVGADGFTREKAGAPNADVCLKVDKSAVLELMMGRLLR